MEFRILGGLEALAGGERLPLGGAREQKTLAVLLLDAGEVVPVPRLVDAVWDDRPPATAVKQVRNAVSRLRSALAVAGDRSVIASAGAGYRIAVADEQLDARRFEVEVARADRDATAGRLTHAAETLRSALALWRGPALADLSGRVIEQAAAGWNERRLDAQETYIDHELALGRHQQVVADLWTLVCEYPLRERAIGQLMLALYRSGRRAEALDIYQDARTRFAIELGVEPGMELLCLYHRLLVDDPAAAVPGSVVAARSWTAAAVDVPRQLPGGVRHFVGRIAHREELTALLDTLPLDDGPGVTVVITAVDGTAGIGKTALAVHWAREVADRFPDGHLYVDLRGYDPSGRPVGPARALRGLLDALGVPQTAIPPELEAQVALYRATMAGRRMLVLLDNARDAEHVRLLLPEAEGCVAVVTSRARLEGLVSAGGVHRVALDAFTPVEAYDLLTIELGPDRTAIEPRSVEVLIGLCARLPLALSVVAAHAATRPELPLAAVAARLVDARSRLHTPMAAIADPAADPRAVFAWCYRGLAEPAARMFRLLALHPGPDIGFAAAARLAGLPDGATRRALGELVGARMVVQRASGWYGLHDLLRAYATDLVKAVESQAERHAAMGRLLDHYLDATQAATRLLDPTPAEPPGLPHQRVAAPCVPTDQAGALAWFDADWPALPGVIARAAELGFDRHACQISWSLVTFLDRRGRRAELAEVLRAAEGATHHGGDRAAEAATLDGLGRAHRIAGDPGRSASCYRAAADLRRQLGDRHGQAGSLTGLGETYLADGDAVAARDAWRRALLILDDLGHPDAARVRELLGAVDHPA